MPGYSILNNAAVREIASSVYRENIVSDIMIVPGKGCSFQYAEDLNGISIAVPRTKISAARGRQIGNGLANGGFINTLVGNVDSDVVQIPLSYVYDSVQNVSSNLMISNYDGKILESVLKNIPKGTGREVNSCYFATCVASALAFAVQQGSTATGGAVTYAFGPACYTKMAAQTAQGASDALMTAFGNLGDGDVINGFDIFPQEDTQLFATGKYLNLLKSNEAYFKGNFLAQEMMSSGTFNAFDTEYRPNSIKGYMGQINGAETYIVGALFTLTTDWLAKGNVKVPAGTLNNLSALLVCGDAVGGGIDLRSEVKVIDLPGGQGVQCQPLTRYGFSVFSPKGVQVIANSTGLTASDFGTATATGTVINTWTALPTVKAPGNV